MDIIYTAWQVFNQAILDYHKTDHVDTAINNPYDKNKIEHLFYLKNWIDTVQWHLEDIIRDPNIDAKEALTIKRRIDASNQHRTDTVEYIDSWFLDKYKDITPNSQAQINTESPAWAIDRLSILALKIFHMKEETLRNNASLEHIQKCKEKLTILEEQHADLSTAIKQLIQDIEQGNKYMKVYKQMKMYNDEDLNPILYQKK